MNEKINEYGQINDENDAHDLAILEDDARKAENNAASISDMVGGEEDEPSWDAFVAEGEAWRGVMPMQKGG